MNPTNSTNNQTRRRTEKVNRANQITTYREPTAWIEIPEDQIPENLIRDDNEPKLIEFCQIIKEHGSDNLTIFKEQLLNNNGPPDSGLPPTAHRCIFWKEIDVNLPESQNVTKQYYTVVNTMDPNDKDLSIESCEEIHKQYTQELHQCSVDAEVTCAMSQEFLELLKRIIEQGPQDQSQCMPNANMKSPEPHNSNTDFDTHSTSTHKYEQDFGRVIEAYPMSCEWFSKKTEDNKNPPHHNMDTTKAVFLENRINENVLLDSEHSATLVNTCHNKKPTCPPPPCPPPPCPPPPCPPPPGCPLQSCDPDDIKIKCSAGDITFKLKCSKLPTDCQNPDGRYECQMIDEGKCIDSKILESCDLKCERIEAIHNGHNIMCDKDLEDAQGPMVATVIEDKKKDKISPTKKVSTMVCTKGDVDFTLKCSKTIPDPDFPADVRFICEIEDVGERKVTAMDIISTTLKCKQISNVIDDSVLGDDDSNKKVTCKSDTKSDESPFKCFVERDKGCIPKIDETKQKKIIYACRSKTKIEKDEDEGDKSDSDLSADFVGRNKNMEDEHCEQQTSFENLKRSYLENHNRTMEILRIATDDLLCTMTDATRELCKDSADKNSKRDNTNVDNSECVNAAKKSCEKLIEIVSLGTKELNRLSRETLDGLMIQSRKYICSEKECQNQESRNCKPHKTSGKSSNDVCMAAIKGSAKNMIYNNGSKNMFVDEQSQQRNQFEKIKPSKVKLINEIKGPSREELELALATVKKSCENLYDKVCETTQKLSDSTSRAYNEVSSKSMKWFDSDNSNEPSTAQKNIQKMLSGITVFQREEKAPPEENALPSRNWTNSIHSVFTSVSDTFKEMKSNISEKSSPYDNPSPPRQVKCTTESEESTPISSMFATLKEKIYGMFYDQNDSESVSSSSSYSDDSEKD